MTRLLDLNPRDGLETSQARHTTGRMNTPSYRLVEDKLTDVTDLHREGLEGKICEALRCTSLSWRIGIAHSDINSGNFMVNKGEQGAQCLVLNDFDFAALMDPGDKSCSKEGLERMRTKPFMALELLKSSSGNTKRLRRHDLESVIWVLVWLCRQDESWCYDPFYEVFMRKASYIDWAVPNQLPKGIDEKHVALWRPAALTVVQWMRRWGDANMEQELKSISDDYVLDTIQKRFPRPREYATWDWKNFTVGSQL